MAAAKGRLIGKNHLRLEILHLFCIKHTGSWETYYTFPLFSILAGCTALGGHGFAHERAWDQHTETYLMGSFCSF